MMISQVSSTPGFIQGFDSYNNASMPDLGVLFFVRPLVYFLSMQAILVTIFIISRKGLWAPMRLYLITLGVVDLLSLIALFLMNMEELLIYQLTPEAAFQWRTWLGSLLEASLLASNWITVALGLERYLAVCHPLVTRRRMRDVYRNWTIGSILVAAYLLRVPLLVQRPAPESALWWLMEAYNWFVQFGLFFLVPFLILLFVNVKLISLIRRSYCTFARTSSSSFSSFNSTGNAPPRPPMSAMNGTRCRYRIRERTEERKVTIMLVLVILSFFLLQGPYVIFTAATVIKKFNTKPSQFLFSVVRPILLVLLAVKSDVNFIFYCWLSDRFSAMLRSLFLCQQTGQQNPNLGQGHTASHGPRDNLSLRTHHHHHHHHNLNSFSERISWSQSQSPGGPTPLLLAPTTHLSRNSSGLQIIIPESLNEVESQMDNK